MGANRNNILSIENLHTQFITEEGVVHAINGVDLSIGKEETLCLVGESGSGKSVTALSTMGLIPQEQGRITQGRILFCDQDLLKLKESEMARIRGDRISMIFQEPMTSLNPVFRIGNQIREAIRTHRSLSEKEANRLAIEMLDKVGIPNPEKRIFDYPHQMSGGMRQRVMIAMALICSPDLLIADEPTTALDVTIQAQILDLMNDLKDQFGTSILLITHDLGVVAETADQVAVMYTGQVVEYADVATFFKTPQHPYSQGLLASIPKLSKPLPEDRMLETIQGTVPSLLDLPSGCSFFDRCPKALERCKSESPPLVHKSETRYVRCWLHA
ncbi:ABC transporter ATP-binding protein [bacterium]|nr:ABC transporter ATP-binding protein [bacterium]